MEGLQEKVQDLERQLCAMQRQIHIQADVSKLAVSLDGRLDEIARDCERRVSTLSERFERLEKEVRAKASTQDMRGLFDEVSRLKEDERRLLELVPRDIKQGVIKRIDAATKMLPIDPLNGIIAQLTREYGGNVHVKGVVEVTASSVSWIRCEHCAVEFGSDSRFCSENKPNSWIRYDFKGRRVAPTSYSIRSDDWRYPRSWVLEVSNDGRDGSWDIVDRRKNEVWNGRYAIQNFRISAPPSQSFRFVRLRQTGKNYLGSDDLVLSSLEVFGALTEIPRAVAAPGQIPFDKMRPMDGIIAQLTRECGGNVHRHGLVEVTSNDQQGGSDMCARIGNPEDVVELGKDSYFCCPNDGPDQWIRWDFKGRRVAPTSYSIGPQNSFPSSWVLEVSNDGSDGSWEVVDRRKDIRDMRDFNRPRNFAIRDPPRRGFRFVRLRRTSTYDRLKLNSLEFFGTLSPIQS